MIKCDACDFRTPYKVCPSILFSSAEMYHYIANSLAKKQTHKMLREQLEIAFLSRNRSVTWRGRPAEINPVPSASFSVESR